MYVEAFEGGPDPAVVLQSAEEARLYALAGFPLFSVFGYKIRRQARKIGQGDLVIHHQPETLPKVVSYLGRQVKAAERRGSPKSADQLRVLADQLLSYTFYPGLPATPDALEQDIADNEVPVTMPHGFRVQHEFPVRQRCDHQSPVRTYTPMPVELVQPPEAQ